MKVGSEHLCLSIYGKEIIDLVAENEDLRTAWYAALTIIVKLFKQLQQ